MCTSMGLVKFVETKKDRTTYKLMTVFGNE